MSARAGGPPELLAAASEILGTADPHAKAAFTRATASLWRTGSMAVPTARAVSLPKRPDRPERPLLVPPRAVPRRRGAGLDARIALLHAVTHIELNAIDLAWDLIARFPSERWPRAFYDQWVAVADDEARHFGMLDARLQELGAHYGDLPAHDGLWDAAQKTCHSPLARLAAVPLVLEARGLDVTPGMIARLEKAGDAESAAVLRVVAADEVSHVAAGWRWFCWLCARRGGLDPAEAYRRMVRCHHDGMVKPPFNHAARRAAGMEPALYEPLADER